MPDHRPKKCSILVVDDDRMMRRLLSHSLGKQYDIRTASDGDEALRLTLDEAPDLILCDIMMPEMDGYDLRIALLQVSCLRRIPFIFVTARYDEKSRARGLALKADDYITKPFDLPALLNRVQELVAC